MRQILTFGFISGAVWSLVPGILSELFRSPGETATVVLSGALSGVLVTGLLAVGLPRVSGKGRILLGLFSLPVGAFAFGFIISFIHLVVESLFDVRYRFVASEFMPIRTGIGYAVGSTLWFPAFVLLPLAVFTSRLFFRVRLAQSGRGALPATASEGRGN